MNALRRQPGGFEGFLADEVDALLGANEDGGPPVLPFAAEGYVMGRGGIEPPPYGL